MVGEATDYAAEAAPALHASRNQLWLMLYPGAFTVCIGFDCVYSFFWPAIVSSVMFSLLLLTRDKQKQTLFTILFVTRCGTSFLYGVNCIHAQIFKDYRALLLLRQIKGAAGGTVFEIYACIGFCCLEAVVWGYINRRYDDVEEEEEKPAESTQGKQSRITSFFQPKPKTGATIDRPKFFVRNRLELITSASRI